MKHLTLLLFLLTAFAAKAQITVTSDPATYLYGAKDATGNVVIPFQYTSLYAGFEGQYIATKCESGSRNCLKGVIDKNNNILIPFEYDQLSVQNDMYMVTQGCQRSWYYDDCYGGTIGFFNKLGKRIVPCIYDNTDLGLWYFGSLYDNRYDESYPNQGLINLSLNGRWGYVDYNGVEVIPFQFESASSFFQDSAVVFLNNQEFYINRLGQCIKNCPDNFILKRKEELSNQTENYTILSREMQKFYNEDAKQFAGDELKRREIAFYNRNLERFYDVISYGTPDQQRVAKYMFLNTSVSLAGKRDTISIIYPYLNRVRFIADNLSESNFPINFTVDGKNYTYSKEAGMLTLANFYETISECEYKLKKGQAEKDFKKAISLGKPNTFNQCLAIGYLIDFMQASNHYDESMLEYSNLLHDSYLSIDATSKARIDSLDLWKTNQPAAIEAAYASKSKSPIPASFYLKAYKNYEKQGRGDYVYDFMNKAYDRGATDKTFLWEYVEMLKANSQNSKGQEVLNKLYIMTAINDCDNLQKIAEYYMNFGNMEMAKEVKDKADECVKKREKEQKLQQKASSKKYAYRGVNNGIYIGIDLLPLCRIDASKRDFGFKMDLIGKNMAHEFYYKIHNNDRDYMFDLSGAEEVDNNLLKPYWNGFTAAYGLKFFTDDAEQAFFIGPMFRYRSKDYGMVDTVAYNPENLNDRFYASFHPKEVQYEVLINYGIQRTKPGIATEFYFGFGPKLSMFSANPVDPDFDNTLYYVENPIIEGRKEMRWGLGARVGFTIGIKIF